MKQAAAPHAWNGTTHVIRTGVSLNLVSLMDIFTILVFFLLVNYRRRGAAEHQER